MKPVKILACILAAAMLLQMVPVGIAAGEEQTSSDKVYKVCFDEEPKEIKWC